MVLLFIMFSVLLRNEANDNVRPLSAVEIKYQQKISHLDQQLNKLNMHDEWKLFDNQYNRDARQEQYATNRT